MSTMGTSGYVSSGYTFATCGVWVAYGTLHSCTTVTPQQAGWTYYWPTTIDLSPLVTEIKALRELLEARLPKPKPTRKKR